jgi:ribosomal protein S18 acetylase RimI-like enzyme
MMFGAFKNKGAGTLRPGGREDEDQVRALADEAFTLFGEYGSWLPDYLSHSGVWSFVYEFKGEVVGFAMIGVIEPAHKGEARLGDLLAIAVKSSHQGRGIGTRLLERTREKAKKLNKINGLSDLRLTVAETNLGARRLFERFGFALVEGNHGHYDKGQRALRLRLKL